MFITENQLDEWVRGNSREAQGLIVELIWRLAAASAPQPKERRFPLGDSIGQHGPDGILEVELPLEPFVPEGRSLWEIGTSIKAGDKATEDYNGLVESVPLEVRVQSTFIFVTPLSARRDWEHTWKDKSQAEWIATRRARGEWRDVRVLDGTKLIDWLHAFPSVGLWLAEKIRGNPVLNLEPLEQHWRVLREIGQPPLLSPSLFLANREPAVLKMRQIFAGNAVQLRLTTHFPDQVVDFVSACLADLDDETRVEVAGRCVLVSSVDAWNLIVSQRERHILIADRSLDLGSELGTKLIQKARRAGHAVVLGSAAGGIPDPTSVALSMPRAHHIEEALKASGYGEERSRALAHRAGGNVGSLLRCLQNLSLLPDWAKGDAAADLAVAAVLGSWSEQADSDRRVVEELSGKGYGEWIGAMREIALRPGTPLIHRDGTWRVVSRFEAWHALAPKIFDQQLETFRRLAVRVLTEKDPKFDMPSEERFAAATHGKVPKHSHHLRRGVAETLAILGSYPESLTSATPRGGERAAVLATREILAGADWQLWASLNDLLPLLAEAAPGEFLDAVEAAVSLKPCPFDGLFAQEGEGFASSTYTSGLLWALETLAWSADYLGRALMCLAQLAAKDPGGRWANRPSNSLSTILLPWYPQTCAPMEQRSAGVGSLLRELPSVGWHLLLSLLPESHSTSMGTRKPEWRQWIPEDWRPGVTHGEYRKQIELYCEMALSAARRDVAKLSGLVKRLDSLTLVVQEALFECLSSEEVIQLPEANRLQLWNVLVDLEAQHRKFAEAEWAMSAPELKRISDVAARLEPKSPSFRYRRLFSERDFDLYEDRGNFDEQQERLDARRQAAIAEVHAGGGAQAVLDFAGEVESPWRVGFAFGAIAGDEADSIVLPRLISEKRGGVEALVGGYVMGRFRRGSWAWVDRIDTSTWDPVQIGQFLAFLPFREQAWQRASKLLGNVEGVYWDRTGANAYQVDGDLENAAELLVRHNRPIAALRCLSRAVHDKRTINSALAVRALIDALRSSEVTNPHDGYEMATIVKALQDSPESTAEDLVQVEWAYLPLLEEHRGVQPKSLWRRLAIEPNFYCEAIRLVFRSRTRAVDEPSPQPTESEKKLAQNAYRLLSEWRHPPGLRDDGTIDREALRSWMESVRREASETGHVEVAMTMAGHVLVSAPEDPSGLWIDRNVAEVLNTSDAGDLRSGFSTELFNRRGVHGFTEGREELELAAKFRAQAGELELAGYQRFAATVRELAETYERFATRELSRDSLDA